MSGDELILTAVLTVLWLAAFWEDLVELVRSWLQK